MGLFQKKKYQPARLSDEHTGQARSKSGPVISAVVPAAGSGARMDGVNKLLTPVAGKPLLIHTLLALDCHKDITELIVVARESEMETLADLCVAHGIGKVSQIVKGGASRAESVLLGLMACRPDAKLAVIHDGARPCVSGAVITEAVRTALRTGAAAPALKPPDTLKTLAPDGRTIASTLDRDNVVHIQTPQCFYPQLIKAALTQALRDGLQPTDDCAAIETLGVKVWITPGDPDNFKITVPADLARAEWMLAGRIGP